MGKNIEKHNAFYFLGLHAICIQYRTVANLLFSNIVVIEIGHCIASTSADPGASPEPCHYTTASVWMIEASHCRACDTEINHRSKMEDRNISLARKICRKCRAMVAFVDLYIYIYFHGTSVMGTSVDIPPRCGDLSALWGLHEVLITQ